MPPELELAWTVDYYGTTLVAGGVLDQPVELTNIIRAVRNVYNAFAHFKKFRGSADEYKVQHPENQQIMDSVNVLRLKRQLNANNH